MRRGRHRLICQGTAQQPCDAMQLLLPFGGCDLVLKEDADEVPREFGIREDAFGRRGDGFARVVNGVAEIVVAADFEFVRSERGLAIDDELEEFGEFALGVDPLPMSDFALIVTQEAFVNFDVGDQHVLDGVVHGNQAKTRSAAQIGPREKFAERNLVDDFDEPVFHDSPLSLVVGAVVGGIG